MLKVRILTLLFGTDGIRGVANELLTGEFAYRIALTIAELLRQDGKFGTILIGKDPRMSSDMLEHALASGFMSRGFNIVSAGIIPTAGLAHLTRTGSYILGVMISASHNQIQDNGLKFFDDQGMKLDESHERQIEKALDEELYSSLRLSPIELGSYREDTSLHKLYSDHLVKIPESSFKGLRIIIDSAHGSACSYAGEAFIRLDASVENLHADPDGRKINVDCGSNYPSIVREKMKQGSADLGAAFDGDADRAILIDEKGDIVNGDQILAMWGLYLLDHDKLKNNTVVGTVLSNKGLEDILAKHNGRLVRTDVGDRYILRKMVEEGYELGGEQSGHIIFLKHNVTGDGIGTALKVADLIRITGKRLSELGKAFIPYPQVALNVPTTDKMSWLDDNNMTGLVAELEREVLKEANGRMLIRPSGTQPLIRIMVEAEDAGVADNIAKKAFSAFKEYLEKKGKLIKPSRR